MGVFGHKVFEPLVKEVPAVPVEKVAPEEPILYFYTSKVKACGRRVPDGFVVFKGSTIDGTISKSCPENVSKIRVQNSEHIVNNTLQRDFLFSSPSAAASFVSGSARNGNVT